MSEDGLLEQLKTQPYLRGAHFIRKQYRQYSPTWDHDHCAACWATFLPPGSAGADYCEGYATTEQYFRGAEYEWVCAPCFEKFHAEMQWVDETPAS